VSRGQTPGPHGASVVLTPGGFRVAPDRARAPVARWPWFAAVGRFGRVAVGFGHAAVGYGHAAVGYAGLGLDQDAARPGRREGLGEVPGPASDIDDELSVDGGVPAQLGHRVGRLDPVEVVGVGLLDAKGPEQLQGPARSPAPRADRGRGHAPRGRHDGTW